MYVRALDALRKEKKYCGAPLTSYTMYGIKRLRKINDSFCAGKKQ